MLYNLFTSDILEIDLMNVVTYNKDIAIKKRSKKNSKFLISIITSHYSLIFCYVGTIITVSYYCVIGRNNRE